MAAKSSRADDSSGKPAASRRRKRVCPRPTSPEVRDFVADWKRWSVGERTAAVVMLVLLVLAVWVAAALIGH